MTKAQNIDSHGVGASRRFRSIFISDVHLGTRRLVAEAVRRLAPGDGLHVAEFGDMAGLPAWPKSAMYTWLRWYHVTPRADLFDLAAELAAAHGGHSRTGGFTAASRGFR